MRVVGDADPYGCAENQAFAFKGPLVGALRKHAGGMFLATDRSGYAARRELSGAVCEADWGIRVRITPNLNISYFLALSPLPCFARLPPLERGALKAERANTGAPLRYELMLRIMN